MGNPINQNNNSNVNLSGKAVKWDGPNIPCLDLCTGDTVTSVLYKMGTRVCELVADYEDLATLDFQCIIDLCTDCPQDYSIKTIIQLLLDNDCKLKDLITSLENQINNVENGGIVLNLNLKCVEVELAKICRDTTNYTINDLLQCLINIICDNELEITDYGARILALEQLVCSLQDVVVAGEYTEPDIDVSCITGNPAPDNLIHNEATTLIAQTACDIREDLGASADVDNAIAQSCLTDFLTNPDIIQSPQNLAQDEKNKWVVICEVLDRLRDIEDNCCSPVCSDISIGFSVAYDEGTNEYTFTFNNGTGTFVPLGFTDCGSTMTLSDQHGNTLSAIPIDPPDGITNNTVWALNAGSLFVTDPVTVKINTCFTHTNGLECVDCFTQTIPAQDVGCKVCKLCASGGDPGDQIQIQYHTLADATVQTVILTEGACLTFDLPDEEPTIDSITVMTPGSSIAIIPDGDCNGGLVIPPSIDPTCWFFPLIVPDTLDQVDCSGAPDIYVTTGLIPTYDELILQNATLTLSGNTCISVSANGTNLGLAANSVSAAIPTSVSSSYIVCMDSVGTYTQGDAGLNPNVELFYNNLTSTDFGIYISLLGQSSSNPPLLKMIFPLTGKAFYAMGELVVGPCPCP